MHRRTHTLCTHTLGDEGANGAGPQSVGPIGGAFVRPRMSESRVDLLGGRAISRTVFGPLRNVG